MGKYFDINQTKSWRWKGIQIRGSLLQLTLFSSVQETDMVSLA